MPKRRIMWIDIVRYVFPGWVDNPAGLATVQCQDVLEKVVDRAKAELSLKSFERLFRQWPNPLPPEAGRVSGQ